MNYNEKQEILNKSIKENRVVPMTVKGDSMQPEFYDGDIVLVDTEYKNPAGGGEFYLEGKNIGMNVIRAEDIGKGIQLIYTNKLYNDFVMSHNEFAKLVKGRVIGHISASLITDRKIEPYVTTKQLKNEVA